jgi:GntR family transcriptional regulator, histidine utilization repressor
MGMEIQLFAYEQVKTFIKTRITSGAWKPGDAVPSETTLMAQFSISRMTVNRALRELTAEGMVTRIQGSGTRVAELHRISSRLTIRDIKDEVVERGHVHTSRVLLIATEKADAQLAKTLNLRAGSKVFHTVLVHLENGIPIQHEDRYVNPLA